MLPGNPLGLGSGPCRLPLGNKAAKERNGRWHIGDIRLGVVLRVEVPVAAVVRKTHDPPLPHGCLRGDDPAFLIREQHFRRIRRGEDMGQRPRLHRFRGAERLVKGL